MTSWQHVWRLRACIPAVSDVLCDPPSWPRFLPHVPRVVTQPDGSLALTVSWHGLRLTTRCHVTTAISATSCTLLLEHRAGLLRGLREEWIATSPHEMQLTLHSDTTWTTPVSAARRVLAQRVYIAGVMSATAAQIALLAQADWRSRSAQTAPDGTSAG